LKSKGVKFPGLKEIEKDIKKRKAAARAEGYVRAELEKAESLLSRIINAKSAAELAGVEKELDGYLSRSRVEEGKITASPMDIGAWKHADLLGALWVHLIRRQRELGKRG